MKKIIIILSILSIVSCTNESSSLENNNDSLEKMMDAESARLSRINLELEALCEGPIIFTRINSGNCFAGVFEICSCFYGVVHCECEYVMIGNQNTIEPYVDFLSDNNFGEVKTAFNNVIESINTEGYAENVMTYKNSIDSLEEERKSIITDWLGNQN